MQPANDTTPRAFGLLADPGNRAARAAQQEREAAEAARFVWTGAKYQDGRPIAAVAREVRRELAAAGKAPGMLAGVACNVRVERGRSLLVRIVGVPAGMLVLSARRIAQDEAHPHLWTPIPRHSAKGRAILAAVEAIVDAYNRSWNDTHQAFHTSVGYTSEVEEADRAEVRATLALLA